MIAILSLLGKLWPFLLAGGGVLFGVFSHMSAKSTKAAAGQSVAEAKTQVADDQNAEAQANAQAAKAGAESFKEKVNVQNDIAALPTGAAASELRSDWSKD